MAYSGSRINEENHIVSGRAVKSCQKTNPCKRPIHPVVTV